MYFDLWARQMAIWLVVVAIAFFGFGALTVWGLPKLWEWLKPLIHAWTA